MSQYQHTQKAFLVRVLFAVIAGIVILSALIAGDPATWPVVGGIIAFLLFVGWLFSSLTVAVTADEVRWHFGPGFWKKRIARDDIKSAEPIGTHCWYGWGIRYTPQGWMYNVSGLKAVKVTERSGKTILIGTDEPDALAAALNG